MDRLTGKLGYTVHTVCGVCTVDGYGQINRPTWLHCPYGLWDVYSGWLRIAWPANLVTLSLRAVGCVQWMAMDSLTSQLGYIV